MAFVACGQEHPWEAVCALGRTARSAAIVRFRSRRSGEEAQYARGDRSQQPGLIQQGDRGRAVAQLGDRDPVRLELVEGGLGLAGGHA